MLIGGRSMSRARPRRPGPLPPRHGRVHRPVAGLSGFLTARENVELGLAIRGVEGIDAHERAIDALVAVGLAEQADRLAELLSAGQRERVAVARALAARTPVIIADEPTSRVDVAAALTLGGLFADIAHEHGTTFICATHDPVLIGFADVDVQLRGRAPRYHPARDGDAVRDTPGDRDPLRAVREPARGGARAATTASRARTRT